MADELRHRGDAPAPPPAAARPGAGQAIRLARRSRRADGATPDAAVILGVDLGLRGALAALTADGRLADLIDMPTAGLRRGRRDYDIAALCDWLDQWAPNAHALAIEYVHAMPRRLGGSIASFALGRASGLFEMWARARRVRLEILPPGEWQRAMVRVRRGGGRRAGKAAARLAAVRLFPDAPLQRADDDGRADALLIAEYTRRLLARAAVAPPSQPPPAPPAPHAAALPPRAS